MRDDYSKQTRGDFKPFPVLQSKGANGQKRIEAIPDANWEWKKPGRPPILEKAGHLLVSMGQRASTGRLTAVASDKRYVGQGWMPVTGLDPVQAKAAAVFLNSTPGRLLIMRVPARSWTSRSTTPPPGVHRRSPTCPMPASVALSRPAGPPREVRSFPSTATATPWSAVAGMLRCAPPWAGT